MKKLLYILNVFDPGAIPNILLDLAPLIRESGWEITFLTLQPPPKDPVAQNRALSLGFQVISLGLKVWQIPQVLSELKKKIAEIDPDLIHSHLGRADLFTAMTKPNIPHITTFHSVMRNFSLATKWGYKWTDSGVAHRTGVSNAVIESLYAQGFLKSPHSVIYNPVSTERLLVQVGRTEVRSRLGIPLDAPVILSVGRFVEAKGQLDLIKALALINMKHPELKLVISGSGPLEKNLKKAAHSLGVIDSIIWTGFSSRVPELILASDLLVFPSHWEGFGLVPLEALILGCPVAVSNLPALREFLEPGPCVGYFPVSDIKAMAETVCKMIESPTEPEAVLNLGKNLATRFSPKNIARMYLDLYERILAKGKGRTKLDT